MFLVPVQIKDHIKIPGYPHSNTIEIEYMIPSGIQNATHPNPGKPFQGTFRKAYLPNNKEGSEVLKVLGIANDIVMFNINERIL